MTRRAAAKDTDPLVSVVVPVMNNAETIADTLRSIQRQTYFNIEVIVWDDHSDDQSVAAVEPFLKDGRFRLIKSPRRLGLPESWTAVSKLASGQFVKLVCADDLVSDELVEEQVRLFSNSPPSVGFVSCNRKVIGPTGSVLLHLGSAWREDDILNREEHLGRLVRSGTTPFGEPMCVLFRSEVLRQIGFWDSTARLVVDLAAYARALTISNARHSNSELASFRLRPKQHSKQTSRELRKSHSRLYNCLRLEFPEYVSLWDIFLGKVAARVRISLKLGLRRILGIDR